MTVEEKYDIIIAMLDEQKSSGKNQKSQQMDFSKIESFFEQLESIITTTSNCTARMESVIETVRKPIISERRITIDIVSKEAVLFSSECSSLLSDSVRGSTLPLAPTMTASTTT